MGNVAEQHFGCPGATATLCPLLRDWAGGAGAAGNIRKVQLSSSSAFFKGGMKTPVLAMEAGTPGPQPGPSPVPPQLRAPSGTSTDKEKTIPAKI